MDTILIKYFCYLIKKIVYFILALNLSYKIKDYTIGLEDGRLLDWQIKEARKKRLREIMFWKLTKRLIGYLVFMSLLFIVTYSSRDPNLYNYKLTLDKFFLTENYKKVFS